MSNVVRFPTEALCDEISVKETTSEVVDAVQQGSVKSIAIAIVSTDGQILTLFSETSNGVELMGAVSRLAHKLQLALDENNDASPSDAG